MSLLTLLKEALFYQEAFPLFDGVVDDLERGILRSNFRKFNYGFIKKYKYLSFREFGVTPERCTSLETWIRFSNCLKFLKLPKICKFKLPNREDIVQTACLSLSEGQQQWIAERLNEVPRIVPKEILDKGGYNKILKIMAGTFAYKMHELSTQPNFIEINQEQFNHEIFKAIQGGWWCFGRCLY